MKTARMGRTIAEKRTGRRNVLRKVLGMLLLLTLRRFEKVLRLQ